MRKLIIASTLLFILTNCILIVIADYDQVDRITYVDELDYAKVMDVRENLMQDGILTHAASEPIYFDSDLGSFEGFLVEKGASVEVGDPLYVYSVANYDQTFRKLTSEIDRLNDEINALDMIIMEMESYRIPNNGDSTQVTFSDEENEYEFDIPNEGQIETEFEKEQFILQKESELASKEAELSSLQNQLAELESTGESITVESPVAGVISQLSTSLEDPLLTVSSLELQAYGELPEEQHPLVKEGMKTQVITETEAGTLEGTVSDVSTVPENGSLETNSNYPVNVAFNENADTSLLSPGYHVALDITLKESLDATVLKEHQIFNQNVWKLTDIGTIEFTPIETGIHGEPWVEIIDGLEAGDYVAYDPVERFRNQTTFITSLEPEKLAWYVIQPENITWRKYLSMGLMVR
ncbi:HlyD family efflux transporter periplasmic adaptor subunit [Filobacillus milosensis]|uniref:HlyD family efflux transporter periplasmic adaptor subunit n=1 Tax=Filobacillus milosensis TaxID=94137 RepID=A0A4Y8IDY3_9BACI|nr:HlyD family efflux transporter periplasmic adaptor subunit [Filobacillus milosensis]TFB14202.1 HlyD family efflux transporter periplasmic adaptor subunit [Filobacillus milosensis]